MKQKDTTRYSAEMRRRWADPAYRALMAQRLSAGQRRRFKDATQKERCVEALMRWRGEKPAEFSAAQSKAATRPRPDHSEWMKAAWKDETTARMYLGVIGTNHAPEYVDRRGRLWRFKSTWELAFAQGLDELGVSWLYEPCRLLLLSGRVYVPDFWIEEWQQYVEIKAAHRSAEKAEQAIAEGHRVEILLGRSAARRFLEARHTAT